MTRSEVVKLMIEKANSLYNNGWSRDGEDEIWTICSDWNSNNPESEIFMSEHVSETTGYVDGFYIEDDYWVFES